MSELTADMQKSIKYNAMSLSAVINLPHLAYFICFTFDYIFPY